MNLTYWELDVVHSRMKAYDIKYQEIYNELFDHIVTAIVEKRNAGDTRSLDNIYQDVIDTHFGGYAGIERMAKSHEEEYKKKVKKMVWANFRYYLNFKTMLFTIGLILLSKLLPNDKLTMDILGLLVLLIVYYPLIYVYVKLNRIKPAKGKKSLVYAHILTQANLPAILLLSIIYIPQLFHLNDDNYKLLAHLNPVIMALLAALITIYDLSCIRLCRQELRSFMNINTNSI